jgi:hypothetical protein
MAFGIAGNIVTAAGSATGLIVLAVAGYLVVMVAQYLSAALFLTAAMRRLSSPEAAEPPAVRPA